MGYDADFGDTLQTYSSTGSHFNCTSVILIIDAHGNRRMEGSEGQESL